MTFSVIIPTYNRQTDIGVCLESILNQSQLPAEVLIIDDGDLDNSFIETHERRLNEKGIRLSYIKKNHSEIRRGSAESRNLGLKLAGEEIVFILDDDLVLEKDFFSAIMKIWTEQIPNEKLMGVGGVIINNRKKNFLENIYNITFALSSPYSWDVNPIGFQVWDDSIDTYKKGFYVHGGVTSYNRVAVHKIRGFSTFQGGRTALEDVDFCLRAKKNGYFFIVEPKAKVVHKSTKHSRESNFLSGVKEALNRREIFIMNCDQNFFNKIRFGWANLGWVVRQFFAGNFSKGLGMLRGLFKRSGL